MRIIGIDPGYHRCGYAVMERGPQGPLGLLASGVIETSRSLNMPERLHELSRGLEQLLELWQPEELAIEELYFAKNVKTGIGVAQARGVVIERGAARGLSVAEYAPSTVKSQLTGNGQADKLQVAYMVNRLIKLDDTKRLDDELDAIAVALCHCQQAGIPAALRKGGRK